jgi:hypothetical protein
MNGMRFSGLYIALLLGRELVLASDGTFTSPQTGQKCIFFLFYHNYDVFTDYYFCRHRVLSSKSKYQGPMKALSCSSTVSRNSMVLKRNQTVMPDTLGVPTASYSTRINSFEEVFFIHVCFNRNSESWHYMKEIPTFRTIYR